MSTMTFVVEFEDGKEPLVHAHMEVLGGKVVSVAFHDALSEKEEPESPDRRRAEERMTAVTELLKRAAPAAFSGPGDRDIPQAPQHLRSSPKK